MINKITRKNYPEHFDSFIDDFYETSYQKHRRDSNFYRQSIVLLNEKYTPEFPELWGFWETNAYIWDDNYGCDDSDIDTLTRVEKRTKIIEEEYWTPVQEEPTNQV
jgi:hypothetical protein